MDLSLTAEQEMLKSAVQRFIQQEYPKETLLEMAASGQPLTSEPWQKLVDTGWLGILIPSECEVRSEEPLRCRAADRTVAHLKLLRSPAPSHTCTIDCLDACNVFPGLSAESARVHRQSTAHRPRNSGKKRCRAQLPPNTLPGKYRARHTGTDVYLQLIDALDG
ncbi:MAG: acyl-CoA dehydrogenase family protein [Chloroflexi bacterium]|nr:acyl-CoA dehydrogenase family protein [Chloroflexota bacterium]